MIDCGQANNLFDAHLNDELSPSLTAELHAHVIACRRCSRSLALLEACGDVIATDRIGPVPGEDFTDRVLTAVQGASRRAVAASRWRMASLWGGSGLAAAAAVVLMVLPLATTQPAGTRTLGEKVIIGAVDEADIPETAIHRAMMDTLLQTIKAKGLDVEGMSARPLPAQEDPAAEEAEDEPAATPLEAIREIIQP